ncbi:MAG: 50S ribosomal protein L11 methyltransferase [Deltaproteobacteria bacterium]|jgi:SAM-dependent methyltransferase
MPADVEYYFSRYGDLELQRRMVADRRRTDAFAKAIRAVVKPEDVVLDVGTGTGILAMLAARAGARQVYAIDQADIAKTAANLVKANGLTDRVKVLQGPAAELELPEKANVLVSEWLGHLAFVEGMLDDVLVARDNNLAEGGQMLPSRVALQLAPVDDPVLYGHDGPGFWRTPVHGLDMSSLEDKELEQGRVQQLRVEPAARLADPATLVALDLATASADDPFVEDTVRYTVMRDGVLSGFVGSFVATLAEGVVLDTSSDFAETHWSQSYFAFAPRPVREGEELVLHFRLARDEDEPRHLRVDLTVGDRTLAYVAE